jgi:uncharacterized protein (TIGR03435 family)
MYQTSYLIAIATVLVSHCLAQTPTVQFEVASVKQAAAGVEGYRGGCRGINSTLSPAQQAVVPLGQCLIRGARLSHLISTAYRVPLVNLKTGPDWIQRGESWFDVQAQASDPAQATEQQLLAMLQNLLVERFQLKFHSEASETSGLALTVAKGGTKLKPAQGDQTLARFAGAGGEPLARPIPGQPISLEARKFSITALANVLAVLGSGPIVDRTGLTGEYDLTLTWDESAGPALSTALREQLGLSVDSTKIPVSTFVVDSAQKPSAN